MKILFTSALVPNRFAEEREKEYRTSLESLRGLGYDVHVIETVKSHPPSFFEDYTDNIYYSNTHDPSIRNIGVREAAALIKGFEYFNAHDSDEMVLKLTGRYLLNNGSYLRFLETRDYDVVAKKDIHNQVFFGCFAMKGRLFYEMLKSFDYASMEKNMVNIEWAIARYVAPPRFEVNYPEKIGVSANIANSGVITCW